jgi:hypothetical protein
LHIPAFVTQFTLAASNSGGRAEARAGAQGFGLRNHGRGSIARPPRRNAK